MLDVLYLRAKCGGVRISSAAGVAKNVKFLFVIGSIARSATRRYLIYSEVDFEVFAPHGRHVAPIWMKFGMEEGGLPNFAPIGAMVRV